MPILMTLAHFGCFILAQILMCKCRLMRLFRVFQQPALLCEVPLPAFISNMRYNLLSLMKSTRIALSEGKLYGKPGTSRYSQTRCRGLEQVATRATSQK